VTPKLPLSPGVQVVISMMIAPAAQSYVVLDVEEELDEVELIVEVLEEVVEDVEVLRLVVEPIVVELVTRAVDDETGVLLAADAFVEEPPVLLVPVAELAEVPALVVEALDPALDALEVPPSGNVQRPPEQTSPPPHVGPDAQRHPSVPT
jgi:hypothetical protein